MPIVSIGIPVYNGELYICEAIESILNQTFTDLEVIICDNASTDKTEQICMDFVHMDSRIKYFKNDINIGAAPNFNKTFRLSTGDYFKWAAHDDICGNDFLEKAVKILDRDPGIVLVYSKSKIINEDGDEMHSYNLKLPTDSLNICERFESLLKFGHKCYEIFGLIRSDILKKTPLMGSYAHGDGVLLARLALFGRFEEIPEYLFFPRIHSEHSGTMLEDYHSWAVWFDPKLRGRLIFPYWRMHLEFFKAVWEVPLNVSVKIKCFQALAKYICMRWHLFVREATYYIPKRIKNVMLKKRWKTIG